MNVSLAAFLARPVRHAASRSAFLPARSVTHLQRSRPLIHSSPLAWTLGSSRNFSWNPFASAKPQGSLQAPVHEAAFPLPPIPEETVAPSVQTPSDTSTTVQTDVSVPTDGGVADTFTETLSSTVDLPSLPGPTQYGDMAALGIVGWSPAGIFPRILEVVQVSTGLHWWSVILLTTVGTRLALLPLIIRSNRTQARMAPLQPKLKVLRERALKARQENDMFAARQTMQQQQALMKKSGINPFESMITVVTQAAVQIGFFLGLRRMCIAPVEQLKYDGISWMTDLTAPDPFYILPLVNFIFVNVQLTLSRRDMLAMGSPNAGHMVNFMRLFTFLGVYILVYLPAGLNIHIVTSVIFISGQTLLLRIPALRKALKLPQLPPSSDVKAPTMKESFLAVKDWFKRQANEASVKEAERQRKIRMVQKQQPRL